MTQSVELLLDGAAEDAVEMLWLRLAEAGLPTELRPSGSPSHRPHISLYAGPEIDEPTDAALSSAVAGLDLDLQLGPLALFGSREGRWVLVHAVVPSLELLELQRRVSEVCGAGADSWFGPGRWTPHVTLARRVATAQVAPVVERLGDAASGRACRVSQCRRWDGTARKTWLL